MRKQINIKISEEMNNKLQALQYECDSRKDLLTFMVNNNVDINSDNFQKYHKEYQDFYAELSILKDEMQKTFLNPQVPGKIIRWNLDFTTNQVTCNYEENTQLS